MEARLYPSNLKTFGVLHEAEEYRGVYWTENWNDHGRFYARVLPFLNRYLVFDSKKITNFPMRYLKIIVLLTGLLVSDQPAEAQLSERYDFIKITISLFAMVRPAGYDKEKFTR